ncbi:hypothetical protein GFU95_03805 [Apibacter sp. B3889]|uniref:hypothetical protein n=1 Tax=unclassified Apibacter TaxID=2630820 RepID=UPI001328C553|nr:MULTISPECIES: hypothetical protein [unclassified Apibacter]MXO31937.1 hypothetical protein [Apibacter sp. B2912]MXO34373.1 hypothetical protein [Apibacter sp. B3883]MXO41496.1 hypothetical protein [Apibacter sp. B3889]MXP03066.1 hypothetical protein [Apibacter sp. B3887]MXP07671.1 hypothetical protein [Apibacter sp. B3935]
MNNLVITKSQFVFYSLAFLGCILAICSSFILPKKYFSDALTIINNTWNLSGIIGSYNFSIAFYTYTGVRWLPFPVVAILQYPILIYILVKMGIPSNFDKIRVNNCLMYFAFFLLGIYISMQTKEFITFLFCTLLVVICKKKNHIIRNRIIVCILLIIFAIVFRNYYFLVLIITLLFSVLHLIRITNNVYILFIYGLLLIILISLAYGYVKGDYMSDQTRTELNQVRLDDPKIREEAKSVIISPVSTDTWYGEAVSILYGFMVVNIPFNSIFSLAPQVVVFAIWQIFLFGCLSLRFKKRLKLKKSDNIRWIYYIVFSFFIVQGLFEPDLGSSIRHKAGIFPLIYFILFDDVYKSKA